MMAQKVIDSDYVLLKERQKSLIKHYERLKEIKETEPKKELSRTISQNKSKPYSEINRKHEISRTNKALLSRLMLITHRKLLTPCKKSATTANIKSLNLQNRRKEAERILSENEQIAKRIQKQKPLIPKKKFDKDFELYKKYKGQLSKLKLLKYQEHIKAKTPNVELKGKSVTPTLELYDDRAENDVAKSPLFARNTFRNHFDLNLSIEDDSSYEEDFD